MGGGIFFGEEGNLINLLLFLFELQNSEKLQGGVASPGFEIRQQDVVHAEWGPEIPICGSIMDS